jgi:hypothetical protein
VREPEITRRISLVAVCRSSDSPSAVFRASSSRNSRTFSIAITAWSANVSRSWTCFSENAPGSRRPTPITPTTRP